VNREHCRAGDGDSEDAGELDAHRHTLNINVSRSTRRQDAGHRTARRSSRAASSTGRAARRAGGDRGSSGTITAGSIFNQGNTLTGGAVSSGITSNGSMTLNTTSGSKLR